MKTYRLSIEISDAELSALLHAIDAFRNDYLDEIKATRKERKAGKLSQKDSRDCIGLYKEGIAASESLMDKIDASIPHND